jgi:hypothetical protein
MNAVFSTHAILIDWFFQMRHAPTQEEIEDPKYKKLLGARVLNEAFTEVSVCPLIKLPL